MLIATPPSFDADVLVVGAGPAGLATAIFARQAGLSVYLVDKKSGAFDKACGEGLLPEGRAALERLGLTNLESLGHSLQGICYREGDICAEGPFGRERGLGLRRTVLMAELGALALKQGVLRAPPARVTHLTQDAEGVTARVGGRSVRTRYLIAADGLHSALREFVEAAPRKKRFFSVSRFNATKQRAGEARYGLRQHYAMKPWSSYVEVYLHAGVEAYVTPVDTSLVGVAFLTFGPPANFETLLAHFPVLARKLAGQKAANAVRGAGPFRQQTRRRVAGRVALVGDAAGYVDALTGEGLTLGFCCAEKLCDLMGRGKSLLPYEAIWRRTTRAYRRDAAVLVWLFSIPWLRRCVLRLVALSPRVLGALILAHGRASRGTKGPATQIPQVVP